MRSVLTILLLLLTLGKGQQQQIIEEEYPVVGDVTVKRSSLNHHHQNHHSVDESRTNNDTTTTTTTTTTMSHHDNNDCSCLECTQSLVSYESTIKSLLLTEKRFEQSQEVLGSENQRLQVQLLDSQNELKQCQQNLKVMGAMSEQMDKKYETQLILNNHLQLKYDQLQQDYDSQSDNHAITQKLLDGMTVERDQLEVLYGQASRNATNISNTYQALKSRKNKQIAGLEREAETHKSRYDQSSKSHMETRKELSETRSQIQTLERELRHMQVNQPYVNFALIYVDAVHSLTSLATQCTDLTVYYSSRAHEIIRHRTHQTTHSIRHAYLDHVHPKLAHSANTLSFQLKREWNSLASNFVYPLYQNHFLPRWKYYITGHLEVFYEQHLKEIVEDRFYYNTLVPLYEDQVRPRAQWARHHFEAVMMPSLKDGWLLANNCFVTFRLTVISILAMSSKSCLQSLNDLQQQQQEQHHHQNFKINCIKLIQILEFVSVEAEMITDRLGRVLVAFCIVRQRKRISKLLYGLLSIPLLLFRKMGPKTKSRSSSRYQANYDDGRYFDEVDREILQ